MEINPRSLVKMVVSIDANEKLFEEFSLVELSLTESMMSPTLQTKLKVQSFRHNGYVKNWDEIANQKINIELQRPILADKGHNDTLTVENVVYRVENREPHSDQIDFFTINGIDRTALLNASKRMSKSWKCTPPHAIVGDALANCVGADNMYLEQSIPNRTYFAENIHPYQVVAQQADVALAGGNDPSFFHFMTYENITGTHRFESLYEMTRKEKVWSYVYSEKGDVSRTWEDIHATLKYSNPCDYDTLSDAMNGIDPSTGTNMQSLMVINPFNGAYGLLGGDETGCGMGQPGLDCNVQFTNKLSAEAEGNCEIDVERHKLTRTARIGLLDADKIPYRATVAFNPNLHVGQMVELVNLNKQFIGDQLQVAIDYGSGLYLIVGLTHRINAGGFGTTTIDCVSQSVGIRGQTLG